MNFVNSPYLNFLMNKQISINQGPPGFRKGKLVAIKSDYFVYLTEDNEYLYCQSSHLKSFVHNGFHELVQNPGVENPAPLYLDANSFRDILQKLMYRKIQIDEGSRDGITGVICNLFNDHIDVVSDNEIIKVFIFHIRAIRQANDMANLNISNEQDTKNEQETVNEQDTKSNEQETKSEEKTQEEVAETQLATPDGVAETQSATPVDQEQNSQDNLSDNSSENFPISNASEATTIQSEMPKESASQNNANTDDNKNNTGNSVNFQPRIKNKKIASAGNGKQKEWS